MDFRDSPEDALYRARVRTWLTDAVGALPGPEPATMDERLHYWRPFQEQLFSAGYAGLAWPRAYGGQAASLIQQAIFLEEYDRAGGPDRVNVFGEGLAGPTIIDFGTDEQRDRFLEPILKGEHVWCQLFSEPAAGSDLVALQARAERDEQRGGWLISGQKVWTSRAQISDCGMLLARTAGADKPRHKIAMATLSYERVALATGRVNMQRLLVELVRSTERDGRPLGEDPFVRRTMADLHARTRVYRLNGLRALDGERHPRAGGVAGKADVLPAAGGHGRLRRRPARTGRIA